MNIYAFIIIFADPARAVERRCAMVCGRKGDLGIGSLVVAWAVKKALNSTSDLPGIQQLCRDDYIARGRAPGII